MNIEMITPFCSRDDTRSYLKEPFVIGDALVACDGVAMVALLLDAPAEPTPEIPEKVALLLANARLAANAPGAWKRAEEIKLSDLKCADCDGIGSVSTSRCDDCDGEGFISAGRHEYECKSCNGEGQHVMAGGDTPCGYCKGTGIHALPSDFDLVHDGRRCSANSVYVALLRKLPNAELCAGLIDGGPIAVRFDGGFGALMPMRNNGRAIA